MHEEASKTIRRWDGLAGAGRNPRDAIQTAINKDGTQKGGRPLFTLAGCMLPLGVSDGKTTGSFKPFRALGTVGGTAVDVRA
jgi:hypothetical protein